MNTPSVLDFTDTERNLAKQILAERYGRPVALEQAEVELQLDPASEALTACAALYWNERGAEFIVTKVGDNRFRCQFQYSEKEQFGTSQAVYTELGDCIVTLLKLQADHEQTRAGVLTGMTGKELGADDDYFGPLVI
jgi:hypothetical protein